MPTRTLTCPIAYTHSHEPKALSHALALKQRGKSAISIPGRQFVPYLSHPLSSDRRNSRIPVVNEFITVAKGPGDTTSTSAQKPIKWRND